MYQIKENYHIMSECINTDNRLSGNEKVICTYILSLSQKYGYCFATNKHFAERYNVSTRTVIRWLNKLEGVGYIKKEMVFENKAIKERRIFPTEMYKIAAIKSDETSISKSNESFRKTKKEIVPIKEEIVTFKEERLIRQRDKKRAEYNVRKCQWVTGSNVTGGGDTNDTVNNTSMFNNNDTHFYPDIQQILAEIKKQDIQNVDAELFFNYHQARGWTLGGSKIYDWVALLKTWEKRGARFKTCEKKKQKPSEIKFDATSIPDWLPQSSSIPLTDVECEKLFEGIEF